MSVALTFHTGADQERALRVPFDQFAKPSANARYLREAVTGVSRPMGFWP
jgi:hypothetical protein